MSNMFEWSLFGLMVGVVANLIDPRPASSGLFSALLLGIVGALVGGTLGDLLFGQGLTGFNLSSFSLAVVGSILLMLIGRAYYHTSRNSY